MPLTFQNSPEKITKTLDWYWNFGVKRIKDHPDYILYRGSWVDDLYRIANTHKPASGERKTLAIWGPSQSGKSTLLSTYLDSETLEVALTALDALRQGNKSVGVISHIDLLKERITTQIVVTKSSSGHSTLNIIS